MRLEHIKITFVHYTNVPTLPIVQTHLLLLVPKNHLLCDMTQSICVMDSQLQQLPMKSLQHPTITPPQTLVVLRETQHHPEIALSEPARTLPGGVETNTSVQIVNNWALMPSPSGTRLSSTSMPAVPSHPA